ncbi:MAG: nuclear transport factor 2 family protein [Hyphomonadaceae bacterium]|nr:nuclear transport factor 2 family protein [Hyphomonadaceae bacterium]
MKVSIYGETAIVTGVENVKGTYRGAYSEMAIRFMNVLVRRDGRWQLVLGQGTPVQAK